MQTEIYDGMVLCLPQEDAIVVLEERPDELWEEMDANINGDDGFGQFVDLGEFDNTISEFLTQDELEEMNAIAGSYGQMDEWYFGRYFEAIDNCREEMKDIILIEEMSLVLPSDCHVAFATRSMAEEAGCSLDTMFSDTVELLRELGRIGRCFIATVTFNDATQESVRVICSNLKELQEACDLWDFSDAIDINTPPGLKTAIDVFVERAMEDGDWDYAAERIVEIGLSRNSQ